jgi:formate hydrogenlyase subunit 3/multisubunit Na+/H+ antiporter MnhD subunit
MFSVAQYTWVMLLVPLLVGIGLAVFGDRLARRTTLGIAIGAAVITFIAALFVAGAALNIAPQLTTLVQFGNNGLVERLDSFAAYCLIGITAWIIPVLLWMTAPRGAVAEAQPTPPRPMGLALVAASLALGAVLLDNVVLIGLCWSGIGFIAWLMARPAAALRPTTTQEWIDLPLLTAGPILFVLVMIFPMAGGKTLSLFDMAGRNLFTPASGLLIVLVLAFAAGIYPFIIWVRHVAQGVLPEAVGVLVLLLTPLAVVLFGRILPVLAPAGTWTQIHIGPVSFAPNALSEILGVVTIVVCGVVLLFERDLLVIGALLNALVLGWCFTAFGTGDPHALVGIMLLLLVQTLGIGALLAVWSSLEWAGRDLQVEDLAGLAHALPGHFAALALAALSLVGMPLLVGFAGMSTIDQSIISQGGTAALGGALVWIGNALALAAVARMLTRAVRRPAEALLTPATWETWALLVPTALLLLFGIAPELLFIGTAPFYGPLVSAAAALLPIGNQFNDIALSPLGFTVGAHLWIPGVFWALGIVATAVIVLAAGLINVEATPSPVFVGGEPLPADAPLESRPWYADLLPVAVSAWVLPGPRAWRYDLAEDDALAIAPPTVEEEEAAEDEVSEEEDGEVEEVVVVEDDEDVSTDAGEDDTTAYLDEDELAAEDDESDIAPPDVAEAQALAEDEADLDAEDVAAEEEPQATPGTFEAEEYSPEETTTNSGSAGPGNVIDSDAHVIAEDDTPDVANDLPATPPPPRKPSQPYRPPIQTNRPRQTGKGGKSRGKR